MENKFIKIAKTFCLKYFTNHNINDILTMLTDDVVWSFSHNLKTAFNKNEVKEILEKETINKATIIFQSEEIKMITDNICTVYLEYLINNENDKIISIIKTTFLLIEQNDNILIKNIISSLHENLVKIKDNSEELNKEFLLIDYKRILDNIASGFSVFRISKDLKIERLYSNEGFHKMLGYLENDSLINLKENNFSRVHPDDLERVYTTFITAFNETKKFKCDYRLKNKEDKFIWVSNSTIIISKSDKYIYACSIYSDINNVKNKELELIESQAKLNAAIEHSSLYYWEYNINDNVMEAGQNLMKDFNLARNLSNFPYSLIEKGIIEDEFVSEFIQLHLDIKTGIPNIEKQIKLNYFGVPTWFNIKYTTIFNQYKKPVQALATAENLSAYKDLEEIFTIATEKEGIYTWVFDIKSKTIYQNEMMNEIFGGGTEIKNAPESVISEGYIHPDDITKYRQTYAKLFNGENVEPIRIRKFNKMLNEYVWYKLTYTIIYDKLNKPFKIIGSTTDITSLIESEQKYLTFKNYQQILNDNTVIILNLNLSKDTCEVIESNNDKKITSTKSCINDVLKNFYTSIPNEKELERFKVIFSRENLIDSFNKGVSNLSIEFKLMLEINKYNWIKATANMIQNPLTEDIEVILYFSNIDKEKNVIAVINSLAGIDYDFICIIDAKTGSMEPFGVKEKTIFFIPQNGDNFEDINEKNIKMMISDETVQCEMIDKTTLKKINEVLNEKRTYTLSTPTVDKTGKKCYLRWKFFYIDESKNRIVFTLIDVTEMYEEEERKKAIIEGALLKAQSASAAKSDFLSRMSHDMRTPMNGIIGLINLTLKENISEKVRSNLNKMYDSSRYLLSLINDTLDMNKIESEKLILNYEIVKANEFLESIIASVKPTIDEKNIEFKIISKNIIYDNYIKVDKVRIQQIFTNVLSNAAKFTPKNGKIEFTIECYKRDKYAHDLFIIKDNGIGMDKEFVEHIFEPFSQENNDVNSSNVGTGLGMSIVKNLINLMNGKIEVNSIKEMGTEVKIWLDLEIINDYIEVKDETDDFSILKGKHILLFEDQPLNAEISTLLLEDKGCIVDVVENGFIGLEQFKEKPINYYDTIFMDIRMPIMNGLEATIEIRKIVTDYAKNIPIIAMTANAFQKDIKESLEVGMNDYLSKPVEPVILYKTLKKWLKNK